MLASAEPILSLRQHSPTYAHSSPPSRHARSLILILRFQKAPRRSQLRRHSPRRSCRVRCSCRVFANPRSADRQRGYCRTPPDSGLDRRCAPRCRRVQRHRPRDGSAHQQARRRDLPHRQPDQGADPRDRLRSGRQGSAVARRPADGSENRSGARLGNHPVSAQRHRAHRSGCRVADVDDQRQHRDQSPARSNHHPPSVGRRWTRWA